MKIAIGKNILHSKEMKYEEMLLFLSKTGSKLIKDIVAKHEDGEFLPKLTDPYLHKRKQHLLDSYCNLVVELGEMLKMCDSQEDLILKFEKWIGRLSDNVKVENKLYFESYVIETGDAH